MKKLFYLIACVCTTTVLHAQYYSFSSTSQPYVETTDETLMDTTFTNYFSFLPADQFTLFGKLTLDSFAAGTSAGYLVASNNSYGFALDPMMGTWLRKIDGKSKLTVTTISEGSDKILVVQWKDIGLYGHPDSDFLNFQVRVSLNTEKITYHYGPSHFVAIANDSAFSDPQFTGPEVMLVLLTADFSTLVEFNTVSGTREHPVFSDNYIRMSNIPLANQAFTFTKKTTTAVSTIVDERFNVSVYPNPAENGVVTISATEPIQYVIFRNALGQEVSVDQQRHAEKEIELKFDATGQPLWAEIRLVNGVTSVKCIQIKN